jgi:acyl-CoA synthetase (NDP forming)
MKKMDSEAEGIIGKALSVGHRTLSEYESKRLVSSFGVPISREDLADDLGSALAKAEEIGYPVVLKACAPQLTHKSERGLVEVNLRNEQQLSEAFKSIKQNLNGESAEFLVQEMVRGDRELVAGLIKDTQYGPCVMFGLGGIFTEVLADVAFRVAPLSMSDAREMIGETKTACLLGPVRGLQAVDMEMLCSLLVTLGRIGLEIPQVEQVDLNPLIIGQGRPVAVDALVVLSDGNESESIEKESEPYEKGDLVTFFAPRSVAVIGASGVRHKAGNDVIRNIQANEYSGELYLVNPKGGEIEGMPVFKAISELPDDVDLAIIILPAKANPHAIRECAAKGITSIVLAAGGFAEVDDRGESLQRDLEKAIRESRVRVLGPNTSGHTSTPNNFTSSFFPLGKVPRGNISYVAQTGNFATHTMRYIATAENFGVARVVGMGNKLDIEESEVLEYVGDDPETHAVFCYLESIKKPRQFLETASRITRKKPVVLLKGGSSNEGARAAVAHTAALSSDQRITEAAFRQAGIVQVWHYSHLILAAKAVSFMPLPQGNRVAFLAPSGAMLVALTDLCQRRLGLEVPNVTEETRQRLQEISPDFIRMRNPVDIWPSATLKGVAYAYKEGMEAVLKDPNIDAIVTVLMLTEETGVPPLDFIPELAGRHPEKPIYITFSAEQKLMDEAKAYLEHRRIPTYPLIEQPFEVLSILARCRQAMERQGD